MKRRGFLKLGIFGGVLLAANGVRLLVWPTLRRHAPRRPLAVLDETEFAVLAAIASRTVIVPGADLIEIAHRVDETLSLGPPEAATDFKRLLALVESGAAGLVLDGRIRPFTRLSPEEKDAALGKFRDSRLVLRRSGYHALRKLTLAACYVDPATWPGVGYPGPPQIQLPPDWKVD